MKILNLYAGIGGNRKLWGTEHEITAVEYDPEIAAIYQDLYPSDRVIVTDAHEYLRAHYHEFDIIWSSPPCQSHSRARFTASSSEKEFYRKRQPPVYPDMKLWQEIVFLSGYACRKLWIVENVIGYYEPLIQPRVIASHYIWSNFPIAPFGSNASTNRNHSGTIESLQKRKGVDLSKYRYKDKRLLMRNCTEPELGKHILDHALGVPTQDQVSLFSSNHP